MTPASPSPIAGRMDAVNERVAGAAAAAGRDPGEVRLMLAIKTQPTWVVREAIAGGAVLFGHNRVQELQATRQELGADLADHIDLRLIGHLQSNKVNAALRHATGVDAVDSVRLANRISQSIDRLKDAGETLAIGQAAPVMVQVNTSGEDSKFGVSPDMALDVIGEVAQLPNVKLTGLMTIGANTTEEGAVHRSFALLRELREAARSSGAGPDLVELSMGMSRDLDIAIAEGATIVRVGTDVFGIRPEA